MDKKEAEVYKILVIVPFPMHADNLLQRNKQLNSVNLDFDQVQFDFKAVSIAPLNYVSGHDMLLADIGIVNIGLQAQEEGYDAICIDTMSDSGMNVLRSVLSIPVIGPSRHAFLVAQMLGERFSVLAMWDDWFHLYKKTLSELGMLDKCASMRSINTEPDNQNLLKSKEETVFPALLEAARKCVELDGADVVILGSTTMHEAHDYLQRHLQVPVINPGPLTYRMALTSLNLGLSHSKSAYPAPLIPKLDLFQKLSLG